MYDTRRWFVNFADIIYGAFRNKVRKFLIQEYPAINDWLFFWSFFTLPTGSHLKYACFNNIYMKLFVDPFGLKYIPI